MARNQGVGCMQVVGHGAGLVVGHDGGLDHLAGLDQGSHLSKAPLRRLFDIPGLDSSDGQVLDGVQAEEGFQRHPVRAVDAVLQQGAVHRVGHVVGLQRAALVEGDALADVEGPHVAGLVDLPLGGQHAARTRRSSPC